MSQAPTHFSVKPTHPLNGDRMGAPKGEKCVNGVFIFLASASVSDGKSRGRSQNSEKENEMSDVS